MVAYFVHEFSPFIWEIRPGFGLRWYGFAYVLAFAAGYWLYRWLAQRGYSPLKPEQVGDFITSAAIFGVLIGGRLGWLLLYGWAEDHSDDPPWWPLQVWKGGMSAHGGMIGLILFTLWYARRHRVSWTGIGDNLCVVAPVGLFFGRVANFINGELWGRPATVPWAVIFEDSGGGEVPRHPSQLYEALLEGALLFAVLWFLRTKTRQPRGILTGLFFVGYAIARCIGEIFREPDPAWSFGPLSAGQFLSLFLLVIGAAFIACARQGRHSEDRP